jgi:hypothetical protein
MEPRSGRPCADMAVAPVSSHTENGWERGAESQAEEGLFEVTIVEARS